MGLANAGGQKLARSCRLSSSTESCQRIPSCCLLISAAINAFNAQDTIISSFNLLASAAVYVVEQGPARKYKGSST